MGILDGFKFMAEGWRTYKSGPSGGPSLGGDGFLREIMNRGEPPKRGSKELMQAYSKMPWLRAVSKKVGSQFASVEWKIYQANGASGGPIKNRKAQFSGPESRRKILKNLEDNGNLKEIENHPLLDLLDKANKRMTGRSGREITQIFLDLKGEAFWLIERNPYGMPIEFYPLPSHWIKDTPSHGKPFFDVVFGAWNGPVPESEIIWFRDLDPLNPYGRGVGIGESLVDELETDEYAAKHTKQWFYNRAVPELLIGVEGAAGPALEAAKAKWENEHRGFWKQFRSHWHSGKLTVTQLSQTFADQQLIELRKFERDTILHVFNISPEIMGIIEHSNRSTSDVADFIFNKHVIVPRLEFFRSELQEWLVPQFDDRIIIDYENPVPADRDFQLKAATAAPWSRTRDEWRSMQDLPPDDKSPDFYPMPLQIIPEKVGEDLTIKPEPIEPTAPGGGPTPPAGGGSPAPAPAKPQGGNEAPPKAGSGLTKAIDRAAIEAIIAALQVEYIRDQASPLLNALIHEWGSKVLEGLSTDSVFSLHNPRVNAFLHERDNMITNINATTEAALRASLDEGISAGESIPKLAKRVRDTFADAKTRRSETIARTETIGATNFASYEAYQQSGVVDQVEWIATKDTRTRDSHRALDGQIAVIGTPFTSPVSLATALHPHGFGKASEDINCRCTTAAYFPDEQQRSAEQREALWKGFDAETQGWERRMLYAMQRAFQKQEHEVMAVLNSLSYSEQ